MSMVLPAHSAAAEGGTKVPFGVDNGGSSGWLLLPRLLQPPETEVGGST